MAKSPIPTNDDALRALPEVGTLRTDQRERRQRIIDAAERLMADVDYDKIQVKDVADEAAVALGTLYRYFNSKDHLFACALVSWAEQFGNGLDRTLTGPTADRVKAIYRTAVRAFEKQPRVYNVTMQIQSSTDPHAANAWRVFAGNQTEAFARVLEPSRLPDNKRHVVTSVMMSVLDESLRGWQLGLHPLARVYTNIDDAADLIFSR